MLRQVSRERLSGNLTMTLPADYAIRYVSFVDILGFANKIRKIDENNALFEQILNINSILKKMGEEAQATGHQIRAPALDVQWSAFSDTIVISVPETRMAGLYAAVVGTQRLCQRLLEVGALSRGGIVIGPLYHKDGVVFGEAMIEAYQIEQYVARVPRIAVSPELAAEWKACFGRPGGLVALKDVIKRDADGVWFIDLFHFPPNDSLDNETHMFFAKSGPILTELLREPGIRLREWSKIVWLATEYNHAPLVSRGSRYPQIEIADFPG